MTIGDAFIKRGELTKQPVKLLLDWQAPSLRSRVSSRSFLHRMWIDGTEFNKSKMEIAA
jgi:hypothetical protein